MMKKHVTLWILTLSTLINLGTLLGQEIHIEEPVFSNTTVNISVSGLDSTMIKDGVLINGERIELSSDEVSYAVKDADQVAVSVAGIEKSANVIPLWMSVLPPLIAIALALIFREVIVALIMGIYTGSAIIGYYMDGWKGLFTGFFRIIDTYVIQAVNDGGHISIIVFSIIIGGVVSLISKNGGMQGVVNRFSKFAKTPKSGQLTTWFLGIAIFFDDYANTLVVGNTMRSVTDKLGISREKLSYIVDSTAAPIAAIGLVTTWIGAELSYISEGIKVVNAEETIVTEGAYGIFLNSIPYLFYPILTLIFMLILILKNRDFGPMLKAERKARKGIFDSKAEVAAELEEFEPVEGIKHKSFNGVVPILTIVIGTILGLIITGFQSLTGQLSELGIQVATWSEAWANIELLPNHPKGVIEQAGVLISSADSYIALLWGSFAGLFVAVILTVGQRILSLEKAISSSVSGFKTMLSAVLILVCAWSLAAVTEEMHTADFLKEVLQAGVGFVWIPTVVFIVSAVVAFSTGSSWSTMALVYPLIIPALFALGLESHELPEIMRILYITVASVLAGSVLGDHCSPISDTTILSSLASSVNHIAHVRTQIPYALTVGGIAILIGIIPTSLGFNPWLALLLGTGVSYLVVVFVGKKVD